MVVSEASGVYDVDEAVAAAGGSIARASGLAVPVLTGGESSSGVGNHAVAVSLAHVTSTLDRGVITRPGASVPTPHGSAGTSYTAGSSTAQVPVWQGRKSGWMWLDMYSFERSGDMGGVYLTFLIYSSTIIPSLPAPLSQMPLLVIDRKGVPNLVKYRYSEL